MRLCTCVSLISQLLLGTALAGLVNPRVNAPGRNDPPYWLEDIKHQGIAAFNNDTTYQVFRNVKDFGAKGDGITDDTAAINFAISSGNRCGPGCSSSTTTAAVVYFPGGTYLVSSSIIDYWETQLIGNPNDVPVIKGTSNFTGMGLIDADLNDEVAAQVEFYRQIRNFVLDTTGIPANTSAIGLHWPTSQATSLQNIVFKLSEDNETQHIGLYIENGSAGFLTDLVFRGGFIAALLGNQQFTMRNLTFSNAITAIEQTFDWSWTYKSIAISNCSTGLSLTAGVGSVTLIDSALTDVPIGISIPSGSLVLENVQISNVGTTIQGPNSTLLEGTAGSKTIPAWVKGHGYTPSGPQNLQGFITSNNRPASLLIGSKFYERSKPQYASRPVSQFLSARTEGAKKGDGITDDTFALQNAIIAAASSNQILFIDAGTYKVTKTIYIPANSKILGESYSVIMSSGSFFSEISNPQAVMQVGYPGETGYVELSDLIVSTQGAQAGATLIEWNLATNGLPSGMWDVHTRIGGFTGSQLQATECPATPNSTVINDACIGAFMSLHITKSATGLYLENNWFWLADHDLDNVAPDAQITVYAGRGIFVESTLGNIWLYGTAAEHHSLYQYQLANTQNVFLGLIQTETAYYQPNPNATLPFPPVPSLQDPDFKVSCAGKGSNCANGWAVRVIDSSNILFYGAGLYSFFDNYVAGTCSLALECQSSIVSLEGSISNIGLYNLATVGATSMLDVNGVAAVNATDNFGGFASMMALFRESLGGINEV